MSRAFWLAAISLFIFGPASAQTGKQARGEYLAKHVSMCVECHSPRDQSGKLSEGELFLGAPIPLESLPQGWAERAPKIARLPGAWTEQDLIRFLQSGRRPDGTTPKRPMPPFRMNGEDAAAIAAFLKSIDTTKGR